MAILSLIAQLVGICTGIYLMFTRSFISGVVLLALVGVGHFLFSNLSDRLMRIHQRRMPVDDLQELHLRAQISQDKMEVPTAWRAIADVCGLAYVIFIGCAVWYFLVR